MTEQQRRIPLGVVAGISAAVVAAVGVGVWWAMNSQSPTPSPVVTPVQPLPSVSPVQPPVAQTAQVYWLRDTGTNLEVVPQQIKVATNQPNAVLESAFNSLLAGESTDTALSSTIPRGQSCGT